MTRKCVYGFRYFCKSKREPIYIKDKEKDENESGLLNEEPEGRMAEWQNEWQRLVGNDEKRP